MMDNEMNNGLQDEDMMEYVTFHVTSKDGEDIEMAVVDEFEYDGKTYVAAAVVKDDEIDDTGHYIYRVRVTEDDFVVEQITKEYEYNHVVEAYMNME